MQLQCGCTIDEVDGILLIECKPHREVNFRDWLESLNRYFNHTEIKNIGCTFDGWINRPPSKDLRKIMILIVQILSYLFLNCYSWDISEISYLQVW